MSDICVEFDHLSLGYAGRPVIRDLHGTLSAGSLTALIGDNGAGKSTLMRGLAGLMPPMAGRCRVLGGRRVAYLPQRQELDRGFPARARDLVMLGLWPRRGLLGRHRPDDRAAVASALEAVGLSGHGDRPLDALSGGQLQRALFARLLVQDADLLLLDEPFTAIDEGTVADLMALLHHWHERGKTALVVVHDQELVRRHFPARLYVHDGRADWAPVAGAPAPVAANGNRAGPFGGNLAWSVPQGAPA